MARIAEARPVRAMNMDILKDTMIFEIYGTSDEVKPTAIYDDKGKKINVSTGSLYIEVDTADSYFYNEEGTVWNKVGGE